MRIIISGTVTPEIAMDIQGYDFDVRTVRNNVNLHFKNSSGIRTDLVAFNLSNGNYEVEMIDDRLSLFKQGLEKGDLLNKSEIVNVMIRQALKEPEMKYANSSTDTRRRNVTGITEKDIGDVVESPSTCDVGTVACSLGAFVDEDSDIESAIDTLDFVPENNVIKIMNMYFIPNHEGALLVQSLDRSADEEFFAFMNILTKGASPDRLRRSMYISGDTYSFDLDEYFNTDKRNYGTIQYYAPDHEFKWVVGYNRPLDVSLVVVIRIIKGVSEGKSRLEIAKSIGKMY